jgi:hypothetical protein
MNIQVRKAGRTWIAEVWDEHQENLQFTDTINTVFTEELYIEINEWCKNTFGYHARTAYHVFELRKQSHLDWFLIRWQ